MGKSPEQMAQAMIDNLREKTGKTLDQWLKIVDATDLAKHGEIIKLLKTGHGVTHGYANLIAAKARERDAPAVSGGDLIEAQYAGAKSELRPIYDKLAKAIVDFGQDVEISPKKAYVSLRRSKQFGLIQPSTRTRVDVGINLKGVEPTDRLEPSGSFNAMVSHRVRLQSPDDVDDALIDWLRQAYERA